MLSSTAADVRPCSAENAPSWPPGDLLCRRLAALIPAALGETDLMEVLAVQEQVIYQNTLASSRIQRERALSMQQLQAENTQLQAENAQLRSCLNAQTRAHGHLGVASGTERTAPAPRVPGFSAALMHPCGPGRQACQAVSPQMAMRHPSVAYAPSPGRSMLPPPAPSSSAVPETSASTEARARRYAMRPPPPRPPVRRLPPRASRGLAPRSPLRKGQRGAEHRQHLGPRTSSASTGPRAAIAPSPICEGEDKNEELRGYEPFLQTLLNPL